MKRVVYVKGNGKIISVLPKNQTIEGYYYHYPEEFKEKLEDILIEQIPRNIRDYKVVNNELVRKSEEEMKEELLRKIGGEGNV